MAWGGENPAQQLESVTSLLLGLVHGKEVTAGLLFSASGNCPRDARPALDWWGFRRQGNQPQQVWNLLSLNPPLFS